jgi:hypothetical protein
MIRIPYHELIKFSTLAKKLSPHVINLLQLPLSQRDAEVQRLLAEFDIPVDDKKEWCTWENDQDYTVFALRWS